MDPHPIIQPHLLAATPDFFNPPRLLRNPHLQSLLGRSPLRAYGAKSEAYRSLATCSRHYLLDCGEGIKLSGEYCVPPSASALVIIIHGWLGSANSVYVLAAAQALHENGYATFRLNLRDHGGSEGINRAIFLATRLQEVVQAIKELQRLFVFSRYAMVGFSLGGNIALRLSVLLQEEIPINHIIAICPPLNPQETTEAIENNRLYHRYFVHRWRKSLQSKLHHFPDLDDVRTIRSLPSLSDLNHYLVRRHSPYSDCAHYFADYTLTEEVFAAIKVPSVLVFATDDPLINYRTQLSLPANNEMTVYTPQYGGHCGFLMNLRLHSWIDYCLPYWLMSSPARPSK